MRRDPSVTNIYFLVASELNLVKIGRTNDVTKRVNFINTSSPVELELVAVLRGVDPIQEQLIHEKFNALRKRGEWFHINDELRAFMTNPVAVRVDPENDWSTCKAFISWYDDTVEARGDAEWLEGRISDVYKCRDILTGDPEWNYISAAKYVFLSGIDPSNVKLLQSNPNKSFVLHECPTKLLSRFVLAPNDVLVESLQDSVLKSYVLAEFERRSRVRAEYPWTDNYIEHHEREREQLRDAVCGQKEKD